MKNRYTKRLISRITIECSTPISVRNGNKTILTDAEVAKDVNGLPYIPGTSIAGVLRHSVRNTEAELLFGKSGDVGGEGSKVIFTDAVILDRNGNAVDGLSTLDDSDNYYHRFTHLPVRQHVAINSLGVAKNGGKFDNEVVYAGTRFCFEIEIAADTDKEITDAKTVISNLYRTSLRIGGGTRNGYGAIKIVSCKIKEYDLTDTRQLRLYLSKTNTLAEEFDGVEITFEAKEKNSQYTLSLQPDDFFIFGSGHGDDQADATPAVEDIVVWKNGKAEFMTDCTLIPASSVKGAISHRVAYNFNKALGRFADKPTSHPKDATTSEAVRTLFGCEEGDTHIRGALVFSDVIIPRRLETEGFNHIRIDSFTSAAINGALFNEKAFYKEGAAFETRIILCENEFERNLERCGTHEYKDKIIEAFETSLKELCSGRLPLGGLTNNGFGRFNGTWQKNN